MVANLVLETKPPKENRFIVVVYVFDYIIVAGSTF